MGNIAIHIADVSEILRSGIAQLLNRSKQIGKIKTYSTAKRLVNGFKDNPEAVCIVSSTLTDMNLNDIMQKLLQINSEAKVIIISGSSDIGNVNHALNLGVKGYITRQVSAKELEETVLTVFKNGQAFSRNVSETIVGYYAHSHSSGIEATRKSITKREKEVLSLIVQGLTSSEIAKRLYISPRTVETHRSNLMQKLQIKNTAGLVRYALEEYTDL